MPPSRGILEETGYTLAVVPETFNRGACKRGGDGMGASSSQPYCGLEVWESLSMSE